MRNDPSRAGQSAGKSETFPGGRYVLEPVHTRSGGVSWFVLDLEREDDLGLPSVIRQEDSKKAAIESMKGLV